MSKLYYRTGLLTNNSLTDCLDVQLLNNNSLTDSSDDELLTNNSLTDFSDSELLITNSLTDCLDSELLITNSLTDCLDNEFLKKNSLTDFLDNEFLKKNGARRCFCKAAFVCAIAVLDAAIFLLSVETRGLSPLLPVICEKRLFTPRCDNDTCTLMKQSV